MFQCVYVGRGTEKRNEASRRPKRQAVARFASWVSTLSRGGLDTDFLRSQLRLARAECSHGLHS